MSEVFLSRRAFDKGLHDTLALKPLRDIARAVIQGGKIEHVHVQRENPRSIVVSQDKATGSWHVRKTP